MSMNLETHSKLSNFTILELLNEKQLLYSYTLILLYITGLRVSNLLKWKVKQINDFLDKEKTAHWTNKKSK